MVTPVNGARTGNIRRHFFFVVFLNQRTTLALVCSNTAVENQLEGRRGGLWYMVPCDTVHYRSKGDGLLHAGSEGFLLRRSTAASHQTVAPSPQMVLASSNLSRQTCLTGGSMPMEISTRSF
ncbi:unnamed protein product [Ectocarpus sp. 4 AP-2014]